MGIYDRNYTQDSYGRQARFMMPTLTPAVKWILIVNVVLFIAEAVAPPFRNFIEYWFAVLPINPFYAIQIWRYISYQFLHDGFFHVFFNMIVVFFFGPMFERLWGTRRFVIFYLTCGGVGGLLYALLAIANLMEPGLLIGASGAIFGLLTAGAILFPNLRVYVYGIFPIPLAVMAVIMGVISFLTLLAGQNQGGELAHLAGMAAGAAFVLGKPFLEKQKIHVNTNNRAWEKKLQNEREFQQKVNEVLDKVRDKGIQSLTGREKKILQQATHREREQNR